MVDIYWNMLTMHGPINAKSPKNTSKWQTGFNATFKGLKCRITPKSYEFYLSSHRCDKVVTDNKTGYAPEPGLAFWIRKISRPRRESNPVFPAQRLA
jgi:hypothetical protein